MCKTIWHYLCCNWLWTESKSLKKVDSGTGGKGFVNTGDSKSSSTDSGKYLVSSTATDFDKFEYKSGSKRHSIQRTKDEIRFISPENAKEDTIESHRIRLLKNNFQLDSELPIGSGAFSLVFPVTRISDKSKMVCKITKSKELAQNPNLLRNMYDEWRSLDDQPFPHLIRYSAQFTYDSKFTYICMEQSDKGSLHNLLIRSKVPFTESQTRLYFLGMGRAINFLHTRRIAHRNLKLDNVLLFNSEDGKEVVKVTDYSMNRISSKSDKVVISIKDAKSITYMSPQILKFYAKHLHKCYKGSNRNIKDYDAKKGDVWALGVCLYYMLFKAPPYGLPPDTKALDKETAIKEKFKYIEQCLAKFYDQLNVPKPVIANTSKECEYLLIDLLEPKASRRIDHFGVVTDPWFRGNPSKDSENNLK